MSKEYIEKEAAIRNVCKGCGLFGTDNCICTGSIRCDEYDAILGTPPADVKPMSAVEYLIAEERWSAWCKSKFAPRSKTYATCVDVFCEYADDKCAQCKLSPQERVAFIERWVKDHPEEVEEWT